MKRPTAPAPPPIRKQRTIVFARLPPGQIPEAAAYLGSLEQLLVEPHEQEREIGVVYDLRQHSLQELETSLEERGHHLDNTLLSKMVRALIHYVEETQLHNLQTPARPLKRSQSQAYTHAWERHPHGDHDDTPPEWREYK